MLLIVFLILVCTALSKPIIKVNSELESIQKALAHPGFTVAFFISPTCPHCKRLETQLEEIHLPLQNKDISFLWIDASVAFSELQVYSFPTIAIYISNNHVHTFDDTRDTKHIQRWIQSHFNAYQSSLSNSIHCTLYFTDANPDLFQHVVLNTWNLNLGFKNLSQHEFDSRFSEFSGKSPSIPRIALECSDKLTFFPNRSPFYHKLQGAPPPKTINYHPYIGPITAEHLRTQEIPSHVVPWVLENVPHSSPLVNPIEWDLYLIPISLLVIMLYLLRRIAKAFYKYYTIKSR